MLDLYGSFQHGAHTIEAWMPGSRDDARVWTIRAYKDGVLVREIIEPMDHSPIFGVDVSDIATLEDITDQLLAELEPGIQLRNPE